MSDIERLLEVAKAVCGANGLTLVASVGAGVFKQTFHVTTADGGSKALKVFNANNRNARVEREVEAMSRCDHPNIAKFDLIAALEFDGDEHLYSLEEYISGGSLEERLSFGNLERADVISIGIPLVNAVAHIAGHDLVHRDLKPANIMLREDSGSPVIVDFGLVRNLDATSITETWIPQGPGTPLFAPPEQLNNEKHLIDWRSDQFALGVVFTMCVTGIHPYQDEGEQSSHAVERVASRGSLPVWFPEWANKHNLGPIYRMVQPWPVQRFRLAEELVVAWRALE
jgi:serine/threonine protein kinase